MTQWTTFAAITVVVLVVLLILTHLTQRAVAPETTGGATPSDVDPPATEWDGDAVDPDGDHDSSVARGAENHDPRSVVESAPTATESARGTVEAPRSDSGTNSSATSEEFVSTADEGIGSTTAATGNSRVRSESTPDHRSRAPTELSTGVVLANVILSQGLFAAVLLGAVLYTGVPAAALGIEFSWAYGQTGLLVGTAVGVVLYAANEVAAAGATRFGFDHEETLRELLAPDSTGGWAILLGVVLPVVAVFEELLFRAILIGAFSVGFGLDPWLLAVVSSVAFGLGHGMQGRVGVAVTTGLGFVLAAVFVLSGSFLVVVVAHYLINAFEFVVHEGLGFDWAETIES